MHLFIFHILSQFSLLFLFHFALLIIIFLCSFLPSFFFLPSSMFCCSFVHSFILFPFFLPIFPFHPSHLCCNLSFLQLFPPPFFPFYVLPSPSFSPPVNHFLVPSFLSLFPFFSHFFISAFPFFFFVFTHLSFLRHGDFYLVWCQAHSLQWTPKGTAQVCCQANDCSHSTQYLLFPLSCLWWCYWSRYHKDTVKTKGFVQQASKHSLPWLCSSYKEKSILDLYFTTNTDIDMQHISLRTSQNQVKWERSVSTWCFKSIPFV